MAYALIGKGLFASLSPELHRLLGNPEYELIEVNDESELADILKDTKYQGFNVTHPYKQLVIKYLDVVNKEATKLRSVNTIFRDKQGLLYGFNTDLYGVKRTIGGLELDGDIVIFGTGGAARTVAAAIRENSNSGIYFVSRNPDLRASEVLEFGTAIKPEQIYSLQSIVALINATPLGAYPDVDKSALSSLDLAKVDLSHLRLIFDLIYNPYTSKFLRTIQDLAPASSDLKICNGYRMLVNQAIKANEIWQGNNYNAKEMPLLEKRLMATLIFDNLNIVAIGMPGSGKTSIMKSLANRLDREFLDSDQIIEQRIGESIPAALEHGKISEKEFRSLESQVIREISTSGGKIIATGGGAIISPLNRQYIKSNSIIIYIRRVLDELSLNNRPISQKNGIDKLYEQRKDIYENMADITIENDCSLEELVPRLEAQIRQAIKS